MQLTNDYYLVLVDQLFESSVTPSGIITRNTAVISEETEERSEVKRRYGRVLEVPANFTDTVVAPVDPGLPAPKRYVGHEWIEMMRQMGHRQGVRPYDEKVYYPSTFEAYDVVTCADIAKLVDAQAGERVYFSENATEEDRKMGPYQGGMMYAVRVDEIQAVVRKKAVFEGYNALQKERVVMQGGWVLVKLDMETWEEITIPVPGHEQGIIIKSAPEAKPLRGWVEEVNHRKDLKRGDHIIFERDADAPCTVEGHDYTIMKDEDILATIQSKIKKV
jgi:co-chaperonin GroES (HSP10)